MNEEDVKKHLTNLEIFETWKNYEIISSTYKLENPLTYEDIRGSFRCYYFGGIYIPEGIAKAKVENVLLRFLSDDIFKKYSGSIVYPIFGFERQLRKRLLVVVINRLPRKIHKIEGDTFNRVWNATFDKEEQKEIIEIRKCATDGLLLISKISSFGKKYFLFLQKVREWEYEQFKKGKVY